MSEELEGKGWAGGWGLPYMSVGVCGVRTNLPPGVKETLALQ